jgi:catechol 2,3-dioxygenase-like lactoylglutathione lyase family enzyme
MKVLNSTYILILFLLLNACQPARQDEREKQQAYQLGIIVGFAEMVQAGVKKLAFSEPMTAAEMDALYDEAQQIANRHGVDLYRESSLIQTDLFPADAVSGMEVFLIGKGTTLEEYRALKEEVERLQQTGTYNGRQRTEIARRLGRMLSYPNTRINELLSRNSEFRTLPDFGIRATNLFLYYSDLKRAEEFYTGTLGFELIADHGMAKIFRLTNDSYLTLVDATKGMHSADEPKTVAIALVTENLEAWHDYLKAQKVKFKYEFNYKPDKPHDGFVVKDPEGYLLEFERFNAHRENENFLPGLVNQPTERITGKPSPLPDELFIHTTVTWLYYKDVLHQQHFMEDILGFPLVVDQGWAKVYRVTNTGYIGLVDERKGMHAFTEKKAVNVAFIIDDLDGWYNYVQKNECFPVWDAGIKTGPDHKFREFIGYDPGGYYLEFDTFNDHPENVHLMKALHRK